MKTQEQMYYDAEKRSGERDRAFMDMVRDDLNPLTNHDLAVLVRRKPERYGRYAGMIGKLPN